MSAQENDGRSRLAIEIEPELRKRIEAAAAEQGVSVRDYVVAALSEALEDDRTRHPVKDAGEWSRLSIPSFARDWDSYADAVYDGASWPTHGAS